MNTFLASVAVLLSAIAVGGAGFALAQTFQLQQSFGQLKASVQNSNSVATSEPPPTPNAAPESLPATDNAAPVSTPQTTQQVNTEIQPGQFVQYAFKNKAKVELLSLKRIPNPETGARDLVNVKIRVYYLQGKAEIGDDIKLHETVARNPDTSETYQSYYEVVAQAVEEREKKEGTELDRPDFKTGNTGYIQLSLMKQGTSADGYVWMSIPEEVTHIDLFFSETAGFLNVPISQ
jgi:hypothetical protein